MLCWVLTIEGLETYILVPRDPSDLDTLVQAVRPAPSPGDVDIVIGELGPIAPPELCNGLMVPMAALRPDLFLRPRRADPRHSETRGDSEKGRRAVSERGRGAAGPVHADGRQRRGA